MRGKGAHVPCGKLLLRTANVTSCQKKKKVSEVNRKSVRVAVMLSDECFNWLWYHASVQSISAILYLFQRKISCILICDLQELIPWTIGIHHLGCCTSRLIGEPSSFKRFFLPKGKFVLRRKRKQRLQISYTALQKRRSTIYSYMRKDLHRWRISKFNVAAKPTNWWWEWSRALVKGGLIRRRDGRFGKFYGWLLASEELVISGLTDGVGGCSKSAPNSFSSFDITPNRDGKCCWPR